MTTSTPRAIRAWVFWVGICCLLPRGVGSRKFRSRTPGLSPALEGAQVGVDFGFRPGVVAAAELLLGDQAPIDEVEDRHRALPPAGGVAAEHQRVRGPLLVPPQPDDRLD